MRKAGKFLWISLGVGSVANFGYYGALYAGAYLELNNPPSPPISTSALAFVGAAMLMATLTFSANTKPVSG